MALTTQLPYSEAGLLSEITWQAVQEIIGTDFEGNLFKPGVFSIDGSADIQTINQLLIRTYGQKCGSGLSLRIGRVLFSRLLRYHESLKSLGELSFRILPLSHKLSQGLPAVAQSLEQILGQHGTIIDMDTEIHYLVRECPDCHGIQAADQPICYVTIGIIKEAMHWLSSSRDFHVYESECKAMGSQHCRFVIDKTPR